MDGMVETRMQDAIHAIGSFWMSAWIDAGQPDLRTIEDNRNLDLIKAEKEKLDKAVSSRRIFGRQH